MTSSNLIKTESNLIKYLRPIFLSSFIITYSFHTILASNCITQAFNSIFCNCCADDSINEDYRVKLTELQRQLTIERAKNAVLVQSRTQCEHDRDILNAQLIQARIEYQQERQNLTAQLRQSQTEHKRDRENLNARLTEAKNEYEQSRESLYATIDELQKEAEDKENTASLSIIMTKITAGTTSELQLKLELEKEARDMFQAQVLELHEKWIHEIRHNTFLKEQLINLQAQLRLARVDYAQNKEDLQATITELQKEITKLKSMQ